MALKKREIFRNLNFQEIFPLFGQYSKIQRDMKYLVIEKCKFAKFNFALKGSVKMTYCQVR